ncbi:MAG: hypothetical protein EOO62_20500 [Hymenobacter sp.]|nr:MAG: hypothetical protein EOO62_20500 [Hymenobacter sp.]
MKLPHLDQLIPLERGEAALLAQALAVLLEDVHPIVYQERPTGLRLTPGLALQLTPLTKLGKRLVARHRQEQARPLKPGNRPPARPVRVHYDELVAVLQNRSALTYTNLAEVEKLQLQRVLGEFQRYSLSLECYINFR